MGLILSRFDIRCCGTAVVEESGARWGAWSERLLLFCWLENMKEGSFVLEYYGFLSILVEVFFKPVIWLFESLVTGLVRLRNEGSFRVRFCESLVGCYVGVLVE